ncbi:MAG: glycoside hydrolase family 57 protein [Campylobacterota bacterium]
MIQGYFAPVLHSHLPFVKHPDYDYFLEEHWLYEAISECYIPLLKNLYRLQEEGVHFSLTVSITPPLAQMLSDAHLMQKYERFLDTQLQLAQKEIERTRGSEFEDVARFYRSHLLECYEIFVHKLDKDILNGYRYFYDLGYIEIITCGATHGFLPLLSPHEKSVEVQIEVAVRAHKHFFKKPPRGIWLPECAYYEGLDRILKENGLEFFFIDTHGLVFAQPTAVYGSYAPAYTPQGVAAFARDAESSKQVWSSKEGYPGDVIYRDFYRDIGYDLEYEYIKPHIDPDGTRVFTGFKYYKITGETDDKQVYDPQAAFAKTQEHAKNFHYNREKQFEHIAKHMDRVPLVVSNYDAELFGHWWFEGPEFLYHLFKQIDTHKVIKAVTPLEYLDFYPKNQILNPSASSWGDKGYYDVWINGGNDWIYPHLHHMSQTMQNLAKQYEHCSDYTQMRVLNQMLRELLLAQSSDWAFLITTETASDYSIARTKEHISNFNRLYSMIEDSNVDIDVLEKMEYKNSIFNFIDYKIYI